MPLKETYKSGSFLSVNQLSLQSGKVCSGKLERIARDVFRQLCVSSIMCFINYVFHQLCVSSIMCFVSYVLHQLCVSPMMCFVNHVFHQLCVSSIMCFRQSTFRVSFHGFMQKRRWNRSIPPKLSVANSFNNKGKLDRRLFKLWFSCGVFKKRDVWKTMHRQTKCCKLSRSTDRNDPHSNLCVCAHELFIWITIFIWILSQISVIHMSYSHKSL